VQSSGGGVKAVCAGAVGPDIGARLGRERVHWIARMRVGDHEFNRTTVCFSTEFQNGRVFCGSRHARTDTLFDCALHN
jgi:hypothetical protein